MWSPKGHFPAFVVRMFPWLWKKPTWLWKNKPTRYVTMKIVVMRSEMLKIFSKTFTKFSSIFLWKKGVWTWKKIFFKRRKKRRGSIPWLFYYHGQLWECTPLRPSPPTTCLFNFQSPGPFVIWKGIILCQVNDISDIRKDNVFLKAIWRGLALIPGLWELLI